MHFLCHIIRGFVTIGSFYKNNHHRTHKVDMIRWKVPMKCIFYEYFEIKHEIALIMCCCKPNENVFSTPKTIMLFIFVGFWINRVVSNNIYIYIKLSHPCITRCLNLMTGVTQTISNTSE